MNVLVTGAFGNIGTSLLEELVCRDHRVRCLDLRTRRNVKAAARFAARVEVLWGDVRSPDDVRRAVDGQDIVVHLAYILPPECDETPGLAEETNVLGTRNLLAAATALPGPPHFFFASSFDVFGHTQHLPPPRRVTDPVAATDAYTRHKLTCEEMVVRSGLPWLIARFADVPRIELRKAHPIMFTIPLDTRIEALHTRDAGVAIANALTRAEAWGKILLIGGGTCCQLRFRDYLGTLLGAMGIGPLPEAAFGTEPYCTDWLDTEESQRLLAYQRHSFDDIARDIARLAGLRRYAVPLLRPLIRRSILRLSPYWR